LVCSPLIFLSLDWDCKSTPAPTPTPEPILTPAPALTLAPIPILTPRAAAPAESTPAPVAIAVVPSSEDLTRDAAVPAPSVDKKMSAPQIEAASPAIENPTKIEAEKSVLPPCELPKQADQAMARDKVAGPVAQKRTEAPKFVVTVEALNEAKTYLRAVLQCSSKKAMEEVQKECTDLARKVEDGFLDHVVKPVQAGWNALCHINKKGTVNCEPVSVDGKQAITMEVSPADAKVLENLAQGPAVLLSMKKAWSSVCRVTKKGIVSCQAAFNKNKTAAERTAEEGNQLVAVDSVDESPDASGVENVNTSLGAVDSFECLLENDTVANVPVTDPESLPVNLQESTWEAVCHLKNEEVSCEPVVGSVSGTDLLKEKPDCSNTRLGESNVSTEFVPDDLSGQQDPSSALQFKNADQNNE